VHRHNFCGGDDDSKNIFTLQLKVFQIFSSVNNRSENLEIEPEEKVDMGEKGPYILQSKMEKAVKTIRNRKATGGDNVPGDVLKLLGESSLKMLTKLINTIYETG
jgi:hypothetical protein